MPSLEVFDAVGWVSVRDGNGTVDPAEQLA